MITDRRGAGKISSICKQKKVDMSISNSGEGFLAEWLVWMTFNLPARLDVSSAKRRLESLLRFRPGAFYCMKITLPSIAYSFGWEYKLRSSLSAMHKIMLRLKIWRWCPAVDINASYFTYPAHTFPKVEYSCSPMWRDEKKIGNARKNLLPRMCSWEWIACK